ncbi:MAG: hypothetical protein OXT01_13905, partial [Rhodospirillaceae bacterium]|nr:hypothetical protein [Rhodospirillaceae bacterium]
GTLPPFDQESTFERSLVAGRAYDEALRHLRGSEGGRDVPYAAPIARAEKSNPEIAAVLWQRGESQAGRGPGTQGHPALPKPGPTERYKGFTLIGSGYPDVDNELFFATLKSAIDMAMGLPPYLRDLVRRIDTAAYHPPTSLRQVTGAILDIDAVYVIADRREKAPVIFYGSMAESSPQRVALSLIGAGVMVARHERLITLFQSPGRAARRERDERLASVSELPQGLVNEAECELQTILYRAEQPLGVTSAQRRARLRLLQQRKCG